MGTMMLRTFVVEWMCYFLFPHTDKCEVPVSPITGKEMVPCCVHPMNNIYVSVKMPLTCSLVPEILTRLNSFLTTTYWHNEGALECIFAASALALHGHNVDRTFWSSGPGGVGQSLMSHLIDSTFGDLHRWVDMSVYISDDEMRKQCELLLGSLVVTGQESPETDRPMREDIFKRHISENPVACRLPYAVVTKMVTLPGWKRYEMNELLRFKERYHRGLVHVGDEALVGHRSQGQVFVSRRPCRIFSGR